MKYTHCPCNVNAIDYHQYEDEQVVNPNTNHRATNTEGYSADDG